MEYVFLGSGSSGNACLVRGDTGLLLDCGFSAAELLRRADDAGWDPRDIRGILLTHEHADHARGASTLAARLGVPVLGTPGTLRKLPDGAYERHPLAPGERHTWGGFDLHLFPVSHDAAQPVGIRVTHAGRSLGLLTDSGQASAPIVEALNGCDHLVVESNHDPDLLANGPYPATLKHRIRGSHGHLSNDACGELLTRVVTDRTRLVVLSHLSRVNNTPELALATNHALLRRGGREALRLLAAPPNGPFGPFTL